MKHVLDSLVFLGFVLLIGGFAIIYKSLPHHPINIEDNIAIQILAFLFWYFEPIIGLILIFISKKRKMKYFGVLFLILWVCAVINYIFLL